MKFTIERDKLVDPLRRLTKVVPTSDLVHALGYVRLDPTDSGIMFTATGPNLSLTYPVTIKGQDLKACTMPAEKLAQVCARFPDGADIRFELSGNGSNMRFLHGRSRYQLEIIDPDEVPRVESQDEQFQLSLPEAVFRTMVRRTGYAMAREDVRYYLLGILLEVNPDRVTTVATDGHRMALAEHLMNTGVKETWRLIVPDKSVDELLENLGDSEKLVKLRYKQCKQKLYTWGNGFLEVDFADSQTLFKTTLIDGIYPDYQAVVPEERENYITLPRAELTAAIKRLAPIATDRRTKDMSRLSLVLGDGVSLKATNMVGDKGVEQFEARYEGEKLSVSLNIFYFQDALMHIDSEEVRIDIKDEAESVLLTDTEDASSKHIIMPISGDSPSRRPREPRRSWWQALFMLGRRRKSPAQEAREEKSMPP